jgi:D-alanyl-lipoteichoic acid acyltransferase DltB (MBOAT superfamily)
MFLRRFGAYGLSKSFDSGYVTVVKNFLCPEMLIADDIVLSFSVFPCQITHCWLLHEQQQMTSMWSNVREWTHVLRASSDLPHNRREHLPRKPRSHRLECHERSLESQRYREQLLMSFPWHRTWHGNENILYYGLRFNWYIVYKLWTKQNNCYWHVDIWNIHFVMFTVFGKFCIGYMPIRRYV